MECEEVHSFMSSYSYGAQKMLFGIALLFFTTVLAIKDQHAISARKPGVASRLTPDYG